MSAHMQINEITSSFLTVFAMWATHQSLWRIYTSANYVIIAVDNDLFFIRCQTIIYIDPMEYYETEIV